MPAPSTSSDATGCRGRELTETRGAARLFDGHSGLEPHLAGEARQQQAVDGAERKHVCAHPAAGRGIRLHARQRALALRELQQGRAIRRQRREHAVRSAEPVLAAQRMPGLEALGRGCDIRPLGRDRGDRGVQPLHEPRPLLEREVDPGLGACARVRRSPRRARRARCGRVRCRGCGAGPIQPWGPLTRALSFGREVSVYGRRTRPDLRRCGTRCRCVAAGSGRA